MAVAGRAAAGRAAVEAAAGMEVADMEVVGMVAGIAAEEAVAGNSRQLPR